MATINSNTKKTANITQSTHGFVHSMPSHYLLLPAALLSSYPKPLLNKKYVGIHCFILLYICIMWYCARGLCVDYIKILSVTFPSYMVICLDGET